MALHHSTLLHITLPRLYFTLLDSTLLYHSSTSHYSTVDLLHSMWLNGGPGLHITLPWLHFNLLDSTLLYHGSTSFYLTLHYSIMALLHSTWLYIILQWLYFTLLNSTLLYHGYFTLLDSTLLYRGSTKFTLHDTTMSLLHSTLVYISLRWWLYFTLHYTNMALLHSTVL